MKLKQKLIQNKTFKKVLIVTSILLIITFLYGFALLNYDLTLINTYDHNYNLNPCSSENEYNPSISKTFACIIYYEEIIIDKIFGDI